MKGKDFPVEFASSLEIAGPTSDGMVHITFVRQEIGHKTKDPTQSSHDGFTAETATTETSAEPVATIIFPYTRFKSLGLIFTKLYEEMAKAQEALKEKKAGETNHPQSSTPGDDGDA